MDGRGVARSYTIQLPTDYDPLTPLALTIVFHGGGSDETGAMTFGLQNVEGAQARSVFVFPRGMPLEEHGVGWNDTCYGYDMAFFDNIVAAVEARYCVDTGRIFVAGFSWGCDFVTALACCRGDRLKAIAAASCSDEFANPDDYRTYANLACPVPNRAAIRFSHAARGDTLYPAPLFATTAHLFRSLNHCSSTMPPEPQGSCLAYTGCTHPVVDCAIPGIGHAPGPHWAEDTWRFFDKPDH